MQILRIILMVCFVFTVYPQDGEAQRVGISKGGDAPPASDLLTIESKSQPALHKSDKAETVDKLGGDGITISNGSPARTLAVPLDPSGKAIDPSYACEDGATGTIVGQETLSNGITNTPTTPTLSNGSPVRTLGVPLGKVGGH